jgi:hypothetical protein
MQPTRYGLYEASRRGSAAYRATEGPELPLPQGRFFFDKNGHKHNEVSIRWWEPEAVTFRNVALGIDGEETNLPNLIKSARTTTTRKLNQSSLVTTGYAASPRLPVGTRAASTSAWQRAVRLPLVRRTDAVPRQSRLCRSELINPNRRHRIELSASWVSLWAERHDF